MISSLYNHFSESKEHFLNLYHYFHRCISRWIRRGIWAVRNNIWIENSNRKCCHILHSLLELSRTKNCHSSFEAEIFSAADAEDRGLHQKQIYQEIFPNVLLKHEHSVDSKSLFKTITTLNQTGNYRLRNIVARMRDSFESKALNNTCWIPASEKYGNVLTKRSLSRSPKPNLMLLEGTWNVSQQKSCALGSET